MRAQTKRVLAVLSNRRTREETAAGHNRHAIELLSNLLAFGALDADDRRTVRAIIDRLWRALREIEQGNP